MCISLHGIIYLQGFHTTLLVARFEDIGVSTLNIPILMTLGQLYYLYVELSDTLSETVKLDVAVAALGFLMVLVDKVMSSPVPISY